MISDRYKCIFTHIPKTAGQSIERFFLNLHGLSWGDRSPLLLRYNPDPNKGPERLAHLTSNEYVSCGYIDEHKFQSYFKFSFVRNPWARIVSEYRFGNHNKTKPFKTFLLDRFQKKSNYADTYRHVIPQYNFLYNETGKLLVDFVGRFENLQDDFDLICSKIGITDSQLPHVNSSNQASIKDKIIKLVSGKRKSKSYHYTDYYDEETEEIVRDMYMKDIKTFKYRFGE